jgi:hypothetical protein
MEQTDKTLIISKLLIPLFFKKNNSFFSKISLKNNITDNKKINGRISNRVVGAFKTVNKYGKKKFFFKSLKKFISSSTPSIITSVKKIVEVIKIYL